MSVALDEKGTTFIAKDEVEKSLKRAQVAKKIAEEVVRTQPAQMKQMEDEHFYIRQGNNIFHYENYHKEYI